MPENGNKKCTNGAGNNNFEALRCFGRNIVQML
jgi:hypothetical protein